MKARIFILAFAMILASCGDDNPNGGGNGGGEGLTNPGGNTGGGNTGGGTGAPNTLFPLKKGLKWTYEIDAPDGSTCLTQDPTLEVKHEVPLGADTAYTVDGNSCLRLVGTYQADGDTLHIGGTIFLDGKLEIDHKWKVGLMEFVWKEKIDEYKTPAGTFKDCWAMESESAGMANREVFCRGVGLVYKKDDFLKIEATLKEKSF